MALNDIVAYKRSEVEQLKKEAKGIPPRLSRDPARDFAAAIRRKDDGHPRVIAEVKKASPSKGIIREDFDPVGIAKIYESSGAAAISVLTDEKSFMGRLAYLTDCRAAVLLPALRKDFIIDEFQVREARAGGADAVLLIAALLDTARLRAFRELASEMGMASLVEAHDENEIESALRSGAEIIGINNRNLHTFEVDVNTTFRLARIVPKDRIIVSESGIKTRDDLLRLAEAGVDAALIGETLMRAPDPGAKLRELAGK